MLQDNTGGGYQSSANSAGRGRGNNSRGRGGGRGGHYKKSTLCQHLYMVAIWLFWLHLESVASK
jgi:hypothetical protein